MNSLVSEEKMWMVQLVSETRIYSLSIPAGVNCRLDGTDWDCMGGESTTGTGDEAKGCTTDGMAFGNNWGEDLNLLKILRLGCNSWHDYSWI